jgi:hypothetical protein
LGTKLQGAIVRQERLIEGLLLLARSQHDLHERSPRDMAVLTASALEHLSATAQQARVTITRQLAPARTSGNSVLL